MVSLIRGLPAIIAEIEQRVLACVPTAFATDTWVKADRKQYEAQNDLLIDYWRHFDLDIHDSDPSPFQGSYAYQNREIQLDLYSWYSRAGANRVAGNPDVDWQALMLQDAHDLQRALQGPIVTADGSTGRLLYDNANRSEDDEEATLVVSFRLPVFLRGTAQVPALYLGPNQAYTLSAGSTYNLVAQSDLACSASLSSSPAGCTHATALDLGSGTPQVIEVTCLVAGTYTFTLATGGTATSCIVVVYAAPVIDLDGVIEPIIQTPDMWLGGTAKHPILYSRNPGTVTLVSSNPAVATVPADVVITGTRTWGNGLKHGQYLARASVLQSRINAAWFVEVNTGDFESYNAGTTNGYPISFLASSFRQDVRERINWAIGVISAKTADATRYWQFFWAASNSNILNAAITSNAALAEQVTGSETKRLIVTYDGATIAFYTLTGTTAAYSIGRTMAGTMGGSEMFAITSLCKLAKMEGSLPSQAQREAYITAGTLPAGLAASYQGGHEIVPTAPVFWDTSGAATPLDLSAVNVQYWPAAAASGDYTDSPAVVPVSTYALTALAAGTTTITATRARAGVPARASDAERFEIVTARLTLG